MIYRLLLIWFLFAVLSKAALVKSFACVDPKQNNISFHPLVTQAFYDEAEEMLRFKILTNVSQDTVDVNYTTNMYTTLHVAVEFTGGEILDKYLRLCDYVSGLDPSDLPFPHNVSSTFNNNNNNHSDSSKISVSSASDVYSSVFTDVSIIQSLTLFTSAVPTESVFASAISTAPAVPDVIDPAVPLVSSIPLTQEQNVPQINVKRLLNDKFRTMVRRDNDDDTNICPLIPNQLIEINYNVSIGKYHKFGSYDLKFSIISADGSGAVIGCNRFYVTPQLPELATTGVAIAVAVLALWMAVVGCFTLIFSPYQESHNPFLLFCSTICNAPLLNQLSPLFDDFIVFVHFLFFMAGLDVQYPGFYQPLVASIRWIALLTSIFVKSERSPVQDNIYTTYGPSSLDSLTLFSTFDLKGDVWSNFMALFALIIGGILLITSLATLVMLLKKNRDNVDYKDLKSKMFFHSLGLINRMCFFVFAMPFLILTIYLWNSPEDIAIVEKWEMALGAIFFICWLMGAFYFIINYIFIRRKRANLYTSLKVILVWSALYHKYEPTKVCYFIIECFEIFLFSVIVALLKDHGSSQVAIIVVLEALTLIGLLYIKPFYLKTKLNSSKMTISIAKLVISILTIPYIRSLGISERNRTFIAYLEAFLILFVIVFIFFVPSIYCLIITITSITKNQKGELLQNNEKNGVEVPLRMQNTPDFHEHTPDSGEAYSIANEYSYYREPHIKSQADTWTQTVSLPDSSSIGLQDWENCSGSPLEISPSAGLDVVMSENPTRKVDYSVREVDKFYNASRVLGPDPEVERLWKAREERCLDNSERISSPLLQPMWHNQQLSMLSPNKLTWILSKGKFNRKKNEKTVPRSFEVERPLPKSDRIQREN